VCFDPTTGWALRIPESEHAVEPWLVKMREVPECPPTVLGKITLLFVRFLMEQKGTAVFFSVAIAAVPSKGTPITMSDTSRSTHGKVNRFCISSSPRISNTFNVHRGYGRCQ
jgi:hypothetical protein